MGAIRNAYNDLVGRSERKNFFEVLGIDENIILKIDLNKVESKSVE
jgi:hypothetical protein